MFYDKIRYIPSILDSSVERCRFWCFVSTDLKFIFKNRLFPLNEIMVHRLTYMSHTFLWYSWAFNSELFIMLRLLKFIEKSFLCIYKIKKLAAKKFFFWKIVLYIFWHYIQLCLKNYFHVVPIYLFSCQIKNIKKDE